MILELCEKIHFISKPAVDRFVNSLTDGGRFILGKGHTMVWMRAICRGWIVVALLCAMRPAHAEEYPTQPVRVIIPFAGGSASDVVSRVLLDKMSKSMGQPMIVENRPGAGGNIGTQLAVNAAADGYTLVGAGSERSTNLWTSLCPNCNGGVSPQSLYGYDAARSPRAVSSCDRRISGHDATIRSGRVLRGTVWRGS